MDSHEIDYKIIGDDMQIVEVELDPEEIVIAEAGMMNYMDPEISFEAKMGDGTNPKSGFMDKMFSVGKRMLTGESIFLTHFKNSGSDKKHIAFAAPYPGKIIPIDLAKIGGEILCQKDAFLCAAFGTKVDIALHKKLGAGLLGGEGFILQKLSGNGKAFIHVGGTVVKKELNNETILLDTGCLAAFSSNISYEITKAGNLKSMFFGGEGFFFAKLSGTGTVYIQSMPFSRLAKRILGQAATGKKGESSVLGGIGNLMMGN